MKIRTSQLVLMICITILFVSPLTGCRKKIETTTPTLESVVEETSTSNPSEKPTSTPDKEGETIPEIQGAGHISPFRNKNVTNVEGIVTVITSYGFYLQSVIPDEDPATSEGIFVYTETPPAIKVGDLVIVDAKVVEDIPGGGYGNLSITTLKLPDLTVVSSGNELPAPTVIGEGGRIPPDQIIDDDTGGFITENVYFDPDNDGIDFYESLESMLVKVNNAVVVGPTNVFKEIVVLADTGTNGSLRTPRGGIVIQVDDYNPERIILDDKFDSIPFVNVGDYGTRPIIGVMDYDYGNFKIQVTDDVAFNSGDLLPEAELLQSEKNQIRIASYNVYNLSALDTQRIAYLADQIVRDLASPDVIGLQEIMDNDGSDGDKEVSADQTYQGIIEAIIRMGGPQYAYVDIDPLPETEGGIPWGNIRQGFLYRLDRGLSLVNAPAGEARTPVEILEQGGEPVLSHNPGRIDPMNPAFYSSRRPLVVGFSYQGETLFIVNNHFASKGPDKDLFGEFQPPLLESENQRIKQAQVVHDFVAELLAVDPDSKVIVLGDLNDFQFSPPLETISGDIMLNLILTLPIEEQYTYIYEGNSQALDHILISAGLEENLRSFDIVHFNCEFRYDGRMSDHDVLVAMFEFGE